VAVALPAVRAPVVRALKDDNLGFKTMRKGVKEA
jgi:hypothetical protein